MSLSSVATILVVDDAPDNLAVLSELLSPSYKVLVANSGPRALDLAGTSPMPDLILLDVMMPEMDGYQVFTELRSQAATRNIPVIFVTGMDTSDDELHGLEAGAVDYVTKPIVPPILLARVRTQLELKQARDWLKDQNTYLEMEVTRRMAENELIQTVSIRALARLAETRDPETGNHILRTQAYVQEIATALRSHPRFAPTLTDRYIRLLAHSAPLHDIGKVGIPDAILLKPGPFTPAEWEIMKTHAAIGADAIDHAETDARQLVEFLALAKEIARSHHEKWDGSGYPDHLSGNSIPISARIMAVADVFDALISVRVYKKAMPYTEARTIIAAGRGGHFDPDITDAFLQIFDKLCTHADRHSDAPESGPY